MIKVHRSARLNASLYQIYIAKQFGSNGVMSYE